MLVGDADLREGLRRLIEQEIAGVPPTIALVPIREVSEDYSYYKITNRNSRPTILQPESLPGSEGLIANLAKSARQADITERLMTSSHSLANMRKAKCRTVFFLDDCVGSGTRVISS